MSVYLFEKIDTTIRHERLYANVNLMREDVMRRFGVSRHLLNELLNSYTDARSFPQYINAIRIEEAHELIIRHPQMTLADVALRVGFTAPNLREQFKHKYGMTPQKFKAKIQQKQ